MIQSMDHLTTQMISKNSLVVDTFIIDLYEGEELPEKGPMPELLNVPNDPIIGHPGDAPIE